MLIHRVNRGEDINDIADMYGLSAGYIQRLNSCFQSLVVGQELIIAYPLTTYTVKSGDTPFSVARDFDMPVSELLRNNPSVYDGFKPGDELVIAYNVQKRGKITLNGYCYTYIGLDLYRRILPYLSYVTIFTYGFDKTGQLIPPSPSDEIYITAAAEYGTAPLMHLSTLTADGVFSSDAAAFLLDAKAVWPVIAENILNNIKEKGYYGVDMDFEYLPAYLRETYAEFAGYLREKLNQNGYILITALAPKTSATQQGLLYEGHDYALLGQNSDLVMPMTYEWGYAYSEPMAVAPIDSVKRVIEYAVSEIPPDKILLGTPFYGYDWQLPYIKGVTVGRSLSPDYALTLAREYGGVIEFDKKSASPYMKYFNGDAEHIVWFESPESLEKKLELIDIYTLRGAGIWSTDRPFAQGYMTINLMFEIQKFI